MLLEPETRYKVTGVEEYDGITWIKVEMIGSSPVIEDVTKGVEKTKEGKHKK